MCQFRTREKVSVGADLCVRPRLFVFARHPGISNPSEVESICFEITPPTGSLAGLHLCLADYTLFRRSQFRTDLFLGRGKKLYINQVNHRVPFGPDP